MLEEEEISGLMEELRSAADILPDAEITIECNPGTANLEKLKVYREIGINRLSIGVQSADDEELTLLGRIHTWEDFLKVYRQAEAAGFTNINLDLMSALPGQTLTSWMNTLEKVLALTPQPVHLSVYSLILEEGTRFMEWEQQGKFCGRWALPSEELDREMAHETLVRLKAAGYHRYEISNFSKEGYECRHNCGYWKRREYLGLGLGAASLLGAERFDNERDIKRYMADPLEGRQSQKLTRREEMEETMFLGLRMVEGVSRKEFQDRFHVTLESTYGAVIEKNHRDGLLLSDEAGVRLTERGMDLSNYVMAQFLF